MVPFSFSIMLFSVLISENKTESLAVSDKLVSREWRRNDIMLVGIFMDIEILRESKQISGYGVDLQVDSIEERS